MQESQNGRSMIEMLGVLAIIGVLSVGGLAGYTKAMKQYRINKTITQVLEISSRVSVLGDQMSSYAGLSNAAVIKMGMVPSELISSSSSLTNVYGGDVTIQNSNLTASDTDMAYIIQYKGISQDACMTLATQDWQNSKGNNLVGIGVGSGDDKLSDIISNLRANCSGKSANGEIVACPNGTVSFPLSMGEALKGCSCVGSGCVFVMKLF